MTQKTGYPSIDRPWLKYYSEEAVSAPLPECTIYEYLWRQNKDYLDRIALNYFDNRIAFRELFHNIDRAAAAFAALQRPYIEQTAINFAYAPPTEADFLARMANPLMPFLAAEEDGRIAGFAYASALRTKEAYTWAVELSVYVREDARGRGIGPALYEKLLPLLDKQGYVSAYACVTLPNPASVGSPHASATSANSSTRYTVKKPNRR